MRYVLVVKSYESWHALQKCAVLAPACMQANCMAFSYRIVNTALRQTQRVSEEGNQLSHLLRRHFADHLSTVPNNSTTFGACRRQRKVNQAFKRGGFAVKSSAGMEYKILFNSLSSSWLIVDLLL